MLKVQRRDCVRASWMRLYSRAIRLHRFIVRQNVFLRLAIHYLDVVHSEANDVDPVAPSVDNLNLCGSSLRAAHDQHHHQAYG